MNEFLGLIINKTIYVIDSINSIINNFIYVNHYNILIALLLWVIINMYLTKEENAVRFKDDAFIIKEDISKNITICITLYILSYAIKILQLDMIIKSFKYIVDYYIPDILIFILLTYITNSKLYKEIENLRKIYRKIILYVSQIFFFISCLFGIKFMLMALVGITIAISINWEYEFACNESCTSTTEVQLYKCREVQLKSFNNIVQSYSPDENSAIALCGEWGSGKSEFLKNYINEYSSLNNYIYIKPMISDTLEGLIKQFSKQLILKIKRQGIYLDSNNSINKYFEEILKLISLNTKVSLNTIIMNKENEDSVYFELKELMQNDIDVLNTTTNKKIVVVIDDFDRIDQEKQGIILYFIKEIIDFKGCTTIFALDYKNVKNNDKITTEYIEKFVQKNIDLAKPDFCEIIEFHQAKILSEDTLEWKFSKDILKEIKGNLCTFHKNIENRVTKGIEELLDKNNKAKSGKEEEEKFLDKLYVFCTEHFENRNNSRKIIYFLDNLQDTIELIDKIYPAYNNGIELVKSINTSEIIYFFNYIRVFEKDMYNDLINSGGVDEYIVYLNDGLTGKNQSEQNKIIQRYFKLMLGQIVLPQNFNLDVFKDEIKELERKNQISLIKDIFIDYNFTVNHIELITHTKKLVSELDENRLCIEKDNLLYSLISILKYINSDKDRERKIHRIERITNYIIQKYQKKELEFSQLMDLLTDNKYYLDIKDLKYYLEPLKNKIEGGDILIGITEYNYLVSVMKYLEINNIFKYTTIFELIFEAISINNKRLTNNLISDITEKIRTMNNLQDLVKELIKFIESNNLISGGVENTITIKEIIEKLIEEIRVGDNCKLPLNLLNEMVNDFLENNDLIEFFRSNSILSNEKLNSFEGIAYNFNLKSIEEINLLLQRIEKEKSINYLIILCFQQSIRYVYENLSDKINKEFQETCERIFDRLECGTNIEDGQYIYISILVQKIINYKVKNTQ